MRFFMKETLTYQSSRMIPLVGVEIRGRKATWFKDGGYPLSSVHGEPEAVALVESAPATPPWKKEQGGGRDGGFAKRRLIDLRRNRNPRPINVYGSCFLMGHNYVISREYLAPFQPNL